MMHRPSRIAVCLAVAAVSLGLLAGGCGGGGSTADSREAEAAIAAYRSYLLKNAEKLTTWTTQLRNKFKLGIHGGAQSRYASSQVPLGHLKPALAFFPAESKQLLAQPAGAFPQVERLLWKEGRTGRRGVEEAGRARAAVLLLHEGFKTVPLPPARVVADAEDTLKEIETVDLRLKATPYAQIDLIPTSANLEGVEAAYAAVQPLAAAADPDLAGEIEKEFKAAFSEVEEFGPPAHNLDQPRPSSPGSAFITTESEQVLPADLKPIAKHVAELQLLFKRLASTVDGS